MKYLEDIMDPTEFFFLDNDREELHIPENIPDKIIISDEFLYYSKDSKFVVRDGPFVVIKGTNLTVCYELKKRSFIKLVWYAEKVKFKGIVA